MRGPKPPTVSDSRPQDHRTPRPQDPKTSGPQDCGPIHRARLRNRKEPSGDECHNKTGKDVGEVDPGPSHPRAAREVHPHQTSEDNPHAKQEEPRCEQECYRSPDGHRDQVMQGAAENERHDQCRRPRQNAPQWRIDVSPQVVSEHRVPVLPETSEGTCSQRSMEHVSERAGRAGRHSVASLDVLGESHRSPMALSM